jgi:hypothetical protein
MAQQPTPPPDSKPSCRHWLVRPINLRGFRRRHRWLIRIVLGLPLALALLFVLVTHSPMTRRTIVRELANQLGLSSGQMRRTWPLMGTWSSRTRRFASRRRGCAGRVPPRRARGSQRRLERDLLRRARCPDRAPDRPHSCHQPINRRRRAERRRAQSARGLRQERPAGDLRNPRHNRTRREHRPQLHDAAPNADGRLVPPLQRGQHLRLPSPRKHHASPSPRRTSEPASLSTATTPQTTSSCA